MYSASLITFVARIYTKYATQSVVTVAFRHGLSRKYSRSSFSRVSSSNPGGLHGRFFVLRLNDLGFVQSRNMKTNSSGRDWECALSTSTTAARHRPERILSTLKRGKIVFVRRITHFTISYRIPFCVNFFFAGLPFFVSMRTHSKFDLIFILRPITSSSLVEDSDVSCTCFHIYIS